MMLEKSGLSAFVYRLSSLIVDFTVFGILFISLVFDVLFLSEWNGRFQWSLWLLVPLQVFNSIISSYLVSSLFRDPIIAVEFGDFFITYILFLVWLLVPELKYLPYILGGNIIS